MTLNVQMNTKGIEIKPEVQQKIQHHLDRLEERLVNFAEPMAVLKISEEGTPKRLTVDLRVDLGNRPGELVSHHSEATPEHAVRLAFEDVERQLERQLSAMRGEDTFGVPSRRLPKELRPSTKTTHS